MCILIFHACVYVCIFVDLLFMLICMLIFVLFIYFFGFVCYAAQVMKERLLDINPALIIHEKIQVSVDFVFLCIYSVCVCARALVRSCACVRICMRIHNSWRLLRHSRNGKLILDTAKP